MALPVTEEDAFGVSGEVEREEEAGLAPNEIDAAVRSLTEDEAEHEESGKVMGLLAAMSEEVDLEDADNEYELEEVEGLFGWGASKIAKYEAKKVAAKYNWVKWAAVIVVALGLIAVYFKAKLGFWSGMAGGTRSL